MMQLLKRIFHRTDKTTQSSLNLLPVEIENMILDYKTEMENYQEMIKYVNQIVLRKDIFTFKEDNNYEMLKNHINVHCQENFNSQLDDAAIYTTLMKNINPDIIHWSCVGCGMESIYGGFTKIEDLPIEFVREFQDIIKWKYVGSGNTFVGNYTKIEDLPIEFVREFKNKIDWKTVGSGRNNNVYNYTHLDNLPKEFVREFHNQIYGIAEVLPRKIIQSQSIIFSRDTISTL